MTPTDRKLSVLSDGGAFFEGPRWHDGRWWVSDFYRRGVYSIDLDGKEEQIATVEQQPSGLGWMPDGSMLIASMKDHRILRQDTNGDLHVHADLDEYCGGHLNDMVVDHEGRAYVGNFGFDLMNGTDPVPTGLVRVDPDGGTALVADDLLFPNGSVITPDGTTLIVGETFGCRYTAFTIAEDGSLTDRRIWAQLAPTPSAAGSLADTLSQVAVAPDGCCLDADDHIWAADALGARCVRIAPGGAIVDEIPGPAGMGVFACMLGGEDGRTLLMCTAPDFFEEARSSAREAVLLTTTVDVPRAGLP
jgi:sugar lactone lactonase YvrE